ncbi:sensor histidine kinase efflux regulator BaeS [Advenella mimigardefordensis]|uniref:histidine kinase n=1 Tax=Advenella mimigardefordensis (strain DSM 17166 / LMG 22922 / DPN7) TaxID=1247726 RepID=W0PC33_ADVMD|nr:sensor histidine kinase efflux regulator BaeS [Advenella mimigardefordensis]AHG63047.1 signal transduction histidine-protein kinase BaeS [Advenella mimigardefordensis DPN7]
MRFSLTTKLFLAILTVCAAVMVMQTMAMRYGFEQGFLGYLNDQGRQSMNEARPLITAAYKKHNNWDFMRNNLSTWIQTLRPPITAAEIRRGPSAADQSGAIVRMGLLDENLSWVSGNPSVNKDSMRLPIIVDKNTVGWIAMVPFEDVLAPGESRFLESQLRIMILIATVSLVIVAVFTFLIARSILRRVRNLAKGTHILAKGDYTSRIAPGARDELGTLADDFNRMAQALENNERTRRAFMADISHELRTPLAVIQAEIEAIQDNIRSASPESLSMMHGEVQQLNTLIGNLHQLSLTDAGFQQYRMVTLDLTSLIRHAATSMNVRFQQADLSLQLDLPSYALYLKGDESRLQQLFSNLLENALRYTDSGGQVLIRGEKQSDTITISIADSPPGVTPEKLDRLFERFYRVEESRNRASGGSGLGLAICRNIVEAHNGKIQAHASALGGLEIRLQFPAL